MSIAELNKVNTPIVNYNLQQANTNIQKASESKTSDSCTFSPSMNFSDDQIKEILDNSFQLTLENANGTASISDYTDSYKKILDQINSDKSLNDNDKSRLTKVLDKCFDTLSDNASNYLSYKISSFFDASYNLNQDLTVDDVDIGLNGNKLLDRNSLKNNIQNMLSAAKVFYKNHPNSSKDDFENYLQKNFSKTTSLDNLSYNDFKNLNNLFGKSDLYSLPLPNKSKFDNTSDQLKYLRDHGSSDIVINGFITASIQNKVADTRVKTYQKLDEDLSSRIDFLKKKISSLKDQIKSMGDSIDALNKEYEKELEDIKNKKLKKQILLAELDDIMSGKTKSVELLTRDHDRTLKKMTKKLSDLYNELNDTSKELAETEKNYTNFKKDPCKYIDNSLNKSEKQKKVNKKTSNTEDSNNNNSKIQNKAKAETEVKLEDKMRELEDKIEVEKEMNMC